VKGGFAEAVAAALAAAGAPFGPPPPAPPPPCWGALYLAVGGTDEADALGLELVHEGYLLHYREPRWLAGAAPDLETRLLAGDVFYARGLHGIAARGDVVPVAVLARLMEVCSALRTLAAPFALDDALWAYTAAALAARRRGAGGDLLAAYDGVAARAAREPGAATAWAADAVAGLARAAASLDLDDSEPLAAELGRAAAAARPSSAADEGGRPWT